MLREKVSCLVASVEGFKMKVEQTIAKVGEYIDSTPYTDKLKRNVKRIIGSLGLVLVYTGSYSSVVASAKGVTGDFSTVGDKIQGIFNPIVELLASLGYPTAYCMLILGTLLVISGRKSKGLDIIKWASVGYIALQLVPFLLGVLDMIGKSLRGSVF